MWIASGILTLFGALIAAELASAFPHAGGVYVFLREAFSPAIAFLWGWAMFWTMHTGIIAVIAMVFARYVVVLRPASATSALRVLATSAHRRAPGVNYVGVRQGSLVQTTFTILKVGAVVAIIVAVFALGPRTCRVVAEPPCVTRTGRAHVRTSRWRSSPACSRSAAGTW